MLIKNQNYTVEITGTGSEGEGVCRIDGFAVFVPYALKGEIVEIKIVKALKNYAFGKILYIVKPSKHRTEPKCEYFYKCGGCVFWHTDYEGELQFKQQKVIDCIARIAGLDMNIEQIIGAQNCEHYRNKGQFPVTPEGIGFFAERSHRLISINNCIIQDKITADVIKIVREFMCDYAIMPYDESNHTGVIRNVLVRVAKNTGEVMVVIVTKTSKILHKDELVKRLTELSPRIVSIIQNINGERTNVAMGMKNITIFGKAEISDKIAHLDFSISPHSFFQINPEQTKVLYDKVVEYAGLKGNEVVLDLYCGIGTISLYIAQFAKQVIGVECVEQAVLNAKENAVKNGVENVEFILGKAEEVAEKFKKIDAIIIDPPRKGCDIKLLDAIKNIKPEKIIYVSCNPATLARDLKILTEYGFSTKIIQPVDMFPRTAHVESVVLITKVDG